MPVQPLSYQCGKVVFSDVLEYWAKSFSQAEGSTKEKSSSEKPSLEEPGNAAIKSSDGDNGNGGPESGQEPPRDDNNKPEGGPPSSKIAPLPESSLVDQPQVSENVFVAY